MVSGRGWWSAVMVSGRGWWSAAMAWVRRVVERGDGSGTRVAERGAGAGSRVARRGDGPDPQWRVAKNVTMAGVTAGPDGDEGGRSRPKRRPAEGGCTAKGEMRPNVASLEAFGLYQC